MVAEGTWRPARVVVDQAAIERNVATLRAMVAPAAVCAVVKANGYSHGAVLAAEAAIRAGAAGLAVALVDEGLELREAGITAPILILAEPHPSAIEVCFDHGLTPTVATAAGVHAAVTAAAARGGRNPVHLKVDTGMHRVGAPPEEAPHLAATLVACPAITLEGCYTHFAVADGTDAESRAFTEHQLDTFDGVVEQLAGLGITPTLLHAANTAGALRFERARYQMVRCGIGIYGYAPAADVDALLAAAGRRPLEPALSLTAEVSAVHTLPAGARPSYGRRRPLPAPATVATVPLGYADGVPRRFFDEGGAVLIGGVRRALAGAVTMDQIVVDCGADVVRVGDPVVLLGRQGDEVITASEWAAQLGTIHYEVLCALSARVPRRGA
jgi:alanine racemase